MQRRHLLQLAAAAACPPAFAQGALAKVKFTLDFRISGQTAPFLVALYKGYYKDEGLDVTIDVGSGSVSTLR